jgi:hypothetical protein
MLNPIRITAQISLGFGCARKVRSQRSVPDADNY